MARLISRQEAALLLDVEKQTVSNWIRKGVIKGHMVDGQWKVDKESIERYFDSLNDLASMEKNINAAKRDLELVEKELRKKVDDARDAEHLFGKGVPALLLKEIFTCICEVAGKDVLEQREYDIIRKIFCGNSVERIADYYGLHDDGIIKIAKRAIRKMATMKSFSDMRREYKHLAQENALFQAGEKAYQNRIKKLELKKNVKSAPLSAYDKLLGDKGGEFTALMNTRLSYTGLSCRTIKTLMAADVETLGDLVQCNKTDLLKFLNYGKKSLKELDDLLESYHLCFGMDIDAIIVADIRKMMGDRHVKEGVLSSFQRGWWSCLIAMAENDRCFDGSFDHSISDTLKGAGVEAWEIEQAIDTLNPSVEVVKCLANYMNENCHD